MTQFRGDFWDQQGVEHEAWLAVVNELRRFDVGDINAGGKHESLHNAIVRWGEELAELRRLDAISSHAANALREKRELYPLPSEKDDA